MFFGTNGTELNSNIRSLELGLLVIRCSVDITLEHKCTVNMKSPWLDAMMHVKYGGNSVGLKLCSILTWIHRKISKKNSNSSMIMRLNL